ncbi:MAG: hypothetical protein HOV77_00035 [Hamadaea sp.]|uniref:hypothetical protein n=1 Tax=Hamadaea sp. TaxID=2024425 RepID=UPI0017AB0D76|nr:hypothetical protein [Hamadaea sp.]NUT17556.1 hypothetical protein [Hamadaea sp.]
MQEESGAMGTLGNGLPDLPPEWGEVVIPDDPAELDEEAEIVRRELRRAARRARRAERMRVWRRRLRLPEQIDDPDEPSALLPLLILAIAVLITLVGLIAVTWSGVMSPRDNPTPMPSTSIPPTERTIVTATATVVSTGSGAPSFSTVPTSSTGTPVSPRPSAS